MLPHVDLAPERAGSPDQRLVIRIHSTDLAPIRALAVETDRTVSQMARHLMRLGLGVIERSPESAS